MPRVQVHGVGRPGADVALRPRAHGPRRLEQGGRNQVGDAHVPKPPEHGDGQAGATTAPVQRIVPRVLNDARVQPHAASLPQLRLGRVLFPLAQSEQSSTLSWLEISTPSSDK